MANILFFGRLGEQFGREVEFAIPAGGCTVADLRAMLAGSFDGGEALRLQTVKACVDQQIVADGAFVRPGQEIAFLPPLSGG